eukprot:gene37132-45811_t
MDRLSLYTDKGATTNRGNVASSMPAYMDVCIGTRVRIVSNILTECGLFNGAMGTVWGFVYKGQGPKTEEERVPPEKTYQIPILVAHARTGHSIQGYTAHDGVVIDVGSSFYA